jgi:hypothetical protein
MLGILNGQSQDIFHGKYFGFKNSSETLVLFGANILQRWVNIREK